MTCSYGGLVLKRRLLPLVLALIMLCFGCGCETAPYEPLVTVVLLQEERAFEGFVGKPCTNATETEKLVREVLGQYPAGFADQWGSVEILLCGELTGEAQFAGGHWAGFTQRTEDGWLVVLDAARCTAGTVHHEFAHILDGILTDAGALTKEEWMEYCPGGFVYGQLGDYPDFFVDEYAMTDIREDRARTFEDAVLYGPGIYADRPALWLKLKYVSRAIREHFDTELWPEKTLWELALG